LKDGTLNLRLSRPTQQPISVSVFDLLGRNIAIKNNEFPVGICQLAIKPLSNIPSGVYVVRASAGNSRKYQKIMVTQ